VPYNNIYWEDVAEGDSLPKVSLELTRDRIVMIVCGTRDIFPLHHDVEFARSMGYKAPAAPIAFLQGLLGRCLTDWTGPTGKIRKIGLFLNSPNYQGDTIDVTGKVTRKYVDADNHEVDCELVLMKQDGTVSARARATVIIPSRNQAPGSL
jgi:3-oxo-4,17-pregnadiene-20-carboxyl-CoA hydratase beta subunit